MKELTIFFTISVLFLLVNSQNSCPYGIENDPYPGQCGRYTDDNGDSICDYSQNLSDSLIEKENNVDSSDESLRDVSNYDTVKLDSDSTVSEEESTKGDNISNYNDDSQKNNQDFEILKQPAVQESANTERKKNKDFDDQTDKYFLFILLPLFLFFLFLIIFSLTHKINVDICIINKYLNIFLIIIFLPLFFTSFLLILVEYDIMKVKNINNIVYIHNFTGIIFILATILHIVIKSRYYYVILKEILKKRGKK